MNDPIWKAAVPVRSRKTRPKKVRRLTVAQILKGAYRRYVRDRVTLEAVKQCLG